MLRLVGDPRTRVLVAGPRRWRSARWSARWCRPRSTSRGARAAGNAAAADLLVQVQLLVRRRRPDRAGGDRARAAPDAAHRRRGAGALRAGPRGRASPRRAASARVIRAPAARRARGRRRRCRRRRWCWALLWLATSAVAVAAGGRFFGHYFHLVLAPLCLLAAPGFCRLWQRGLVAAGAAGGAVRAAGAALLRRWPPSADRSPRRWTSASRATTRSPRASPSSPRPTNAIFVWGNSPQLYVLARRPMGARFSFCNYMTGESPGTPTETGQWNADANQLPARVGHAVRRSRAASARRCSSTRPPPAGTATASTRSRATRGCAPTSTSNYRPVEVRAGVVLYRRLR